MTNAELIAKIKAEIEKLKTFYGELHTDFVCETLLSFLSTLESEKPMNPDDAMKELDEKIALVKQRGTWDGVDVDRYMDEVRGREPENPMDLEEEIKRFVAEYGYERSEDILLIAIVARHFAEWGYLRAAEKYNEIEYNRQRAEENIPKDLEEAAHLFSQSPEPLYSPGHRFHWDDDALFGKQIETTFIAGAKWQKGQMMKDALHGWLDEDNEPPYDLNVLCEEKIPFGKFKHGDKVRIIIVKED